MSNFSIKTRKDIVETINNIYNNCFDKDLNLKKGDSFGGCQINSEKDMYFNSINNLRDSLKDICSNVKDHLGKDIEINDLLNFSQEDFCNKYQTKIFKDISDIYVEDFDMNDYDIYSVINHKRNNSIWNNDKEVISLSDKPKLHYFSKVNDKVLPIKYGNSLSSPLYGNDYLTKYGACQELSIKFVKILNLIGCILVLLLEDNPFINIDIKNISVNTDKPFFYRQLRGLLNKDLLSNDYKISLCNLKGFNLFSGKDYKGEDILLNDILPLRIISNLYKTYEIIPGKIKDDIISEYYKINGPYNKILESFSLDKDWDIKYEGDTIKDIDKYKLKNYNSLDKLKISPSGFSAGTGSDISSIKQISEKTSEFDKKCRENSELFLSSELINKENDMSSEDIKSFTSLNPGISPKPLNDLINDYNLLRSIYLKVILQLIKYLFLNDSNKDNKQINNLFIYCVDGNINCQENKLDDLKLLFTDKKEILNGKIIINEDEDSFYFVPKIKTSEGIEEYDNTLSKKIPDIIIPDSFYGQDWKVIKILDNYTKDEEGGPKVISDINNIELQKSDIKSGKLTFVVVSENDPDKEISMPPFMNEIKGMWKINFSIDDNELEKICLSVRDIMTNFIDNFERKYSNIISTILNIYLTQKNDSAQLLKFEEKNDLPSGVLKDFETVFNIGKSFQDRDDLSLQIDNLISEINKSISTFFGIEKKNLETEFKLGDLFFKNPNMYVNISFTSKISDISDIQNNNLSNRDSIVKYFQYITKYIKDNGLTDISINNEIRTISQDLDDKYKDIILNSVCGNDTEDTESRREKRSDSERKSESIIAGKNARKMAEDIGENNEDILNRIERESYNQCYSNKVPLKSCTPQAVLVAQNCNNLFDSNDFNEKETQKKCSEILNLCKDVDIENLSKEKMNSILNSKYYNKNDLILLPEDSMYTSPQKKCFESFDCKDLEWKDCYRESAKKYHPDKTGCGVPGNIFYNATKDCSSGQISDSCDSEKLLLYEKCKSSEEKMRELVNCKKNFVDKSGDSDTSDHNYSIDSLTRTSLKFPLQGLYLDEITAGQKQTLESSLSDYLSSEIGVEASKININFNYKEGGKKSKKKKPKKKKTCKQRGGAYYIDATVSDISYEKKKEIDSNISELIRKISNKDGIFINQLKKMKTDTIDETDCSAGNESSQICRRILGPSDGSLRRNCFWDWDSDKGKKICKPLPTKEELKYQDDCSSGIEENCQYIGGPKHIPGSCKWIKWKKSGECVVNEQEDTGEEEISDARELDLINEDIIQSSKRRDKDLQKKNEEFNLCKSKCENECSKKIKILFKINISDLSNASDIKTNLKKIISNLLDISIDSINLLSGGFKKKKTLNNIKKSKKTNKKKIQFGGNILEIMYSIVFPPSNYRDLLINESSRELINKILKSSNSSLISINVFEDFSISQHNGGGCKNQNGYNKTKKILNKKTNKNLNFKTKYKRKYTQKNNRF